MSRLAETAYAKLNLALHVRGRLPDGRHRLETIFAFCEDGDRLTLLEGGGLGLSRLTGPFADQLLNSHGNLVTHAAQSLAEEARVSRAGPVHLEKRLPVSAGIGGGSADAAATLRLLTRDWQIDAGHAEKVARRLGSDVPACLLSSTCRGEGAGDQLHEIDGSDISDRPVLLVNPRVELPTREVFMRWDGVDRGPLDDWRNGRNDLETAAVQIVPQISAVLAWLWAQPGAGFVRMSGSGATCFCFFDSDAQRDRAAEATPREWWHLATKLR